LQLTFVSFEICWYDYVSFGFALFFSSLKILTGKRVCSQSLYKIFVTLPQSPLETTNHQKRAPDWFIPSPASPSCQVACELHSRIDQNKKRPIFLAPPKTTHKAKVQTPLVAET